MIYLTNNNIKLDAEIASKTDAIYQVGTILVRNGNIKSSYIRSMIEREEVASTYLGNGIVIPHGLPQDRDLIMQTGLSVLQIPNGLEWNGGEWVRLVIGIAAQSQEHLQILINLTHLLDDAKLVQRLATTTNPDDMLAVFNQGHFSYDIAAPRASSPFTSWKAQKIAL
jgi:phosphocarrier protein FPr